MLSGYKTYIGLLVAAVPTVASLFGYDTSPSFQDDFTHAAEDIVTVAGLIIALYGRLYATAPGWFAKKP